jgi:hypothetical protein
MQIGCPLLNELLLRIFKKSDQVVTGYQGKDDYWCDFLLYFIISAILI